MFENFPWVSFNKLADSLLFVSLLDVFCCLVFDAGTVIKLFQMHQIYVLRIDISFLTAIGLCLLFIDCHFLSFFAAWQLAPNKCVDSSQARNRSSPSMAGLPTLRILLWRKSLTRSEHLQKKNTVIPKMEKDMYFFFFFVFFLSFFSLFIWGGGGYSFISWLFCLFIFPSIYFQLSLLLITNT